MQRWHTRAFCTLVCFDVKVRKAAEFDIFIMHFISSLSFVSNYRLLQEIKSLPSLSDMNTYPSELFSSCNLFWSSSNFPSSTSLQIQAEVGARVYLTTRETEEGHLWPINTQILITSTKIIAKGTICTQGLSAFNKVTESLPNLSFLNLH